MLVTKAKHVAPKTLRVEMELQQPLAHRRKSKKRFVHFMNYSQEEDKEVYQQPMCAGS